MLFAPTFTTRFFGFPESSFPFFPSQSGIFLVVLGVCYLLALRDTAFVRVIVVSKVSAVAFLVVHAGLLGGPDILWAAAAGDGAMLAAVLVALSVERRSASSGEAEEPASLSDRRPAGSSPRNPEGERCG